MKYLWAEKGWMMFRMYYLARRPGSRYLMEPAEIR